MARRFLCMAVAVSAGLAMAGPARAAELRSVDLGSRLQSSNWVDQAHTPSTSAPAMLVAAELQRTDSATADVLSSLAKISTWYARSPTSDH